MDEREPELPAAAAEAIEAVEAAAETGGGSPFDAFGTRDEAEADPAADEVADLLAPFGAPHAAKAPEEPIPADQGPADQEPGDQGPVVLPSGLPKREPGRTSAPRNAGPAQRESVFGTAPGESPAPASSSSSSSFFGSAPAPRQEPVPPPPPAEDAAPEPVRDMSTALRRRPRPARDPLGPDFGPVPAGPARTTRIVADDLLLTVNPVDGSEVTLCPPGELPERPAKRGPAVRAERSRAARPPLPSGPAGGPGRLLERTELRERITRLLARGRSVRLTGPGGSGKSALLAELVDACAELAPDGVVLLSGRGRTPADLLGDLATEVFELTRHRPGPALLRELLAEVGAVVIVDDLEFGAAALDEILDVTPECAFLLATTPDTPAPSAEARLEELTLSGVGRPGGLALLERAVGRALSEEEANWAGDLWFESEGLPLRFVQAGALLQQRDALTAEAGPGPDEEDFAFFAGTQADAARPGPEGEVPLPTLAEGAAPAAALAARLSEAARETLRHAVALGGELPHPAHLPALTGDTHADAALAELTATVLVTPAGSGRRLATGVLVQLEAAGYAEDAPARADAVARHYAWWAAHPSVTPERVAAEAEAVLAALAACVAEPLPPVEGEGAEDD
ncbi:ATP-binding protein, partial [Streptomyces sp. SPB074]|uniref:ATP-binding protein n=1 Tax=Streptomyces sp. (strain SPB074) TaxID=465543 RepID=UPI0001D1E2C3